KTLQGFIAARAPQIQLEGHLAPRRGDHERWLSLGLRRASVGGRGPCGALELVQGHAYPAAEDFNLDGAVTNGEHATGQTQPRHHDLSAQLNRRGLRRFWLRLRHNQGGRRDERRQAEGCFDRRAGRLRWTTL